MEVNVVSSESTGLYFSVLLLYRFVLNHDPFSRSFPQQRRASRISIEYEESYVEMDGSTTAGSPFAAPNFAYRRHVRVMQELNTRRSQRHEQTARAEAARRNAPKSNAAFESRDEGCVIL